MANPPLDLDEFKALSQGQTERTPEEPQGPLTLDEFQSRTKESEQGVVRSAIGNAVGSFREVYQDAKSGFFGSLAETDNQVANLFMVLDRAADHVAEATGTTKGGAFGKIEETYRELSEEQAAKASEAHRPGILAELNRVLFSLPTELPKAGAAVAMGGPVAGFAWLGALSEANEGPVAAAKGAAAGALTGKVFQIASPIPSRAGRLGTVGSGVAAVESSFGANLEEALLGGATAGALSAIGPAQGRGTRRGAAVDPARLVQETRRTTAPAREPAPSPKPRIRMSVEKAREGLVEVTTLTKDNAARAAEPKPSPRLRLEDDRVVNLNLRRVRGPEDFKAMQRELVGLLRPHINEARRDKITLAETERMAESLGMTADQLRARRRGQAFNAEELTAARTLHQTVAKELFDSARRIRQGEATDAAKADFAHLLNLYEGSAKQMLGATAEAGRALSALRIEAGPKTRDLRHIQEVMEQFRQVNRGKGVEAFAEMVGRLETPGQLTKVVSEARKASTSDKFLELYVNGLLSNPQTHSVNAMSNALVAMWTIPEAYTSAAFSGLSRAAAKAAGRPAPEAVFLREGNARAFGFVQGAREGARLAARTLRTGESSDVFTKFETRRGSIPGRAGRIVRLPGDFLLAGDEFFKAIGYRQELNARAARTAAQEGLRGSKFRQRVGEIMSNPPAAMREAAIENARVQTFTNPLGAFGSSVVSLTNSHPTMKLLFPFVRTPINIFKFSAKRTPLAPMFSEVRENIRAGGSRRAEELGRVAFGTMVGTAVLSAAAEGKITGSGPADPELRRAWLQQNQPYSVRIGDQWVSYGRLEPLGSLLGVAADYGQISGHLEEGEAEEAGSLLWLSFRNNVENKTFLQGLTNLLQATDDPGRHGERFLGRLAAGMIPFSSLGAQVARQQDPVLRRADTVIDHVKSRTPGFTTDLPPVRNIWGEPVFLEGGLGPDFVSPLYSKKITPDKATEETIRTGAKLRRPSATVGQSGPIPGVELTPMERDRTDAITGRLAKQMVDRLVATPEYGRAPKVIQRDLIEKLYSKARNIARSHAFAATLENEPERYQKVVREAVRALRATEEE